MLYHKLTMNSNTQVPDAFVCMISHEIMENPVIDPTCNVTYDRDIIVAWLSQLIAENRPCISPISKKPLTHDMLIPNLALRDAINDFKRGRLHIAAQPASMSPASSAPSVLSAPLTPSTPKPEITLSLYNQQNTAIIAVNSPVSTTPAQIFANVCCVVDVSGSMNSQAAIKTNNGEADYGFTILDIVKHALMTIVAALGEHDYFSLVVFSNHARVKLQPTKMTASAKTQVQNVVNSITGNGTTNLWDGIVKAINLMYEMQTQYPLCKNSHIILLTDGEPNIHPPNTTDYVQALNNYRKQRDDFAATIHTIGFGYTLDSNLLRDISCNCGGYYTFVPDASFVGTVFINLMSNILTTVANNVAVRVKLSSAIYDTTYLSEFTIDDTNDTITFYLGNLTLAQTRYILLPINDSKSVCNLSVELCANYNNHENQYTDVYDLTCINIDDANNDATKFLQVLQYRCRVINDLNICVNKCMIGENDAAIGVINNAIGYAENNASAISGDDMTNALVYDLKTQISMSVTPTHFKRWGQHYLRSFISAHSNMICNNFKDKSVKYYGGHVFKNIRDHLNVLFDDIVPPAPSGHVNTQSNITLMQTFNDNNAPCFHGSSLVLMVDGTFARVDCLKRGDIVNTPNGNSTVLCIVQYICTAPTTAFTQIGDFLITPWHPVCVDGNFIHANRLQTHTVHVPCDSVYNILLQNHHMVRMRTCPDNTIDCVTLAHGFDSGDAAHEYFASNAVHNDLIKFAGWVNGLVQLRAINIHRDPKTNLVCAFKPT